MNDASTPLPLCVELALINDALLKHASFINGESKNRFWFTQVAHEEFRQVLADSFWFVLKHLVHTKTIENRNISTGSTIELVTSPHFNRISCGAVTLMKKVPRDRLKAFQRRYEEILAFYVICAFQQAFPNHRQFKTELFVQRIIDLCSEWHTGLRLSKGEVRPKKGEWILCALAEKYSYQTPTPKLFAGKKEKYTGPRKSRVHYDPSKYRRVRYDLKHSPIVDCYLRSIQEKELPHLDCHIVLTEDIQSPLKTMFSNKQEQDNLACRPLRSSSSAPILPTAMKDVQDFRKSIVTAYISSKKACRQEKELIRKGEFSYVSQRPVTRQMEAIVKMGDVHELSNCIIRNNRTSRPQTSLG